MATLRYKISTKCENPAKVRLVGWFWAPPGTKSGVKCAWCSLSKNADFYKYLIQSTLQNLCRVWRKHQVRKPGKSAPGGLVLSPTRYDIGGKVRLVLLVKKCEFSQSPHPKYLMKSLPSLTLAPGAKTRQKCAWWAGFGPHQVRKPGKSAPGVCGSSNSNGHCHPKNGKLFM